MRCLRKVQWWRRAALLVLMMVLLGGLPLVARAQDSMASLEARVKAQGEILKLVEQAMHLENEGKVDEALPLVERSLEIAEKSLGPEDFNTAMALVNLARLREKRSETDLAVNLYERSLRILEKVKSADDFSLTLPLNSLASLYARRGDDQRAEAFYLRSLAIQEKASGPEHTSVALTLNFLASLYSRRGDYARAEPLLVRALAIREKASGPEHIQTAVLLNNLATVYDAQADYARAETHFRRALSIYEKHAGYELQVTRTLNNLASLYRVTGDYAQAESSMQRALEVGEKSLGPEHPDVAGVLNNLAQLLYDKGDYARSEAHFRRALAIREKTQGAQSEDIAAILNNLALLHGERKDYARAEEFFKRSIAMYEATLGREHHQVATAVNNLATLYWSQGDFTRAEALLQRALETKQKALGAAHPDVALALHNLAVLYEAKGDYVKAEPLYRQALEIEEKALGENHPTVAGFLANLATMLWAKGDIGQSVSTLTRSAEIRERNLSYMLNTGSEEQKRLYLATLTGETDATISLHLGSARNEAAALSLALNTILRRKGRALDAMSDQVAALRRRLNAEDRALLDQLSQARAALAAQTLKAPSQTADAAQYRAETIRLEAEVQRLEAAVSARSAEFRAASQAVTLERVQGAIPANAALVEIISYRPFDGKAQPGQRFSAPHYAAYVLRHEGAPAWVELGEAAKIDAEIAKLRAALRDPDNAQARAAARSLDERVMRPIRRLLGETRVVFLSPDGELNLVPFGALVDEQNRFLIERYSFTYLTSGRDLLRLQAQAENRQAPLVLADPSFAKANDAAAVNNAQAVKTKASRRSVDLFKVNFEALPGTAEEAAALRTLLPNARVLTGAEATEASLKSANGPQILHVATHGFFLDKPKRDERKRRGLKLGGFKEADAEMEQPGENPLLRAGLVFAGANAGRGGAGEDGILTALEASALNLWGTKLVVLSACETGLGEARKGDGVYGLRRALVLAGAESQVMSLWQVADDATRDLMIDYYKALQAGEGRSEALRRVQLKMLKDPETRHPYYWASFIPAGDWRGLKN